MNEYRRGYNWYVTGYLTERPEHLTQSLFGSLNRIASSTQSRHIEIWTQTALFYLGAILGQQERGIWSELVDGQEITHAIA